jgi:hypothetical protein
MLVHIHFPKHNLNKATLQALSSLSICASLQILQIYPCFLQDVDVANHTWANYFVCAYKVRRDVAAVLG